MKSQTNLLNAHRFRIFERHIYTTILETQSRIKVGDKIDSVYKGILKEFAVKARHFMSKGFSLVKQK